MTHRRAFLALLALWAAFFAPLLARGEVIYPHDNRAEVGQLENRRSTFFEERVLARFLPWVPREETRLSSRRLSDESSVYVPELHQELHGDHSGWISLWNPHVQMGRPTSHVSGLSPAYPWTRLFMALTSDATRLFTWIVLFHSLLTACAAFAFLGELRLGPWARFSGAAFASLGFFPIYWLVQPMFGAGVAWTLALLWAGTKLLRAPSWSWALATAVSAWCLLLAGYPQQIVWHLYLMAVWFGLVWWKEIARASKLTRGLALVVAGCVGALAAWPVYADVAVLAAQSLRNEAPEDFLLQSVLRAATWKQAAGLVAVHFDPYWIDTPVQEEYPERLFGFAFSAPLAALCVVAALRGGWRSRAAPWLAFVVAGVVLNAWPDAYLVGVRYLGLSLSRFAPLIVCAIPVPILAALAVERVLARGSEDGWDPWRAAWLASLPFVVAISCGAFGLGWLRPGFVGAALALHALTLLVIVTRRAGLVFLLVIASVLHYGYRVQLVQPPRAIARDSALVSALREATQDGSRYAIAGFERWGLLPPNQDIWLGLSSPHSYDSLSSKRFNDWLLSISQTGARARGRSFRRIEPGPGFFGDAFTWAGIGAVIATHPIESPHLDAPRAVGGVELLRTRAPARLAAQLARFERADGELVVAGALDAQPQLELRAGAAHDDRASYVTTASDAPSVVFLSRQFHPAWRARGGGRELEVLPLNGLYLGIVVPPHTREVELAFEPWVRFAWVPQLVFGSLALVVALRALARRRTRST